MSPGHALVVGALEHLADPHTGGHLLDVNLTAAAPVTPRVLARYKDATPSTLVLIGWGAAHRVFPDNAAYAASQHGRAALGAAAFLDVREVGVRVSAVSLGFPRPRVPPC